MEPNREAKEGEKCGVSIVSISILFRPPGFIHGEVLKMAFVPIYY